MHYLFNSAYMAAQTASLLY